jgi:hypothetical protein
MRRSRLLSSVAWTLPRTKTFVEPTRLPTRPRRVRHVRTHRCKTEAACVPVVGGLTQRRKQRSGQLDVVVLGQNARVLGVERRRL